VNAEVFVIRIARNILISFAALLVVTLILLLTIDLGRFKATTENLVSDVLGRDFTIGGEFQIHLGRQIYINAEDVRLADAAWSSNEDFARVGHFEVSIDTWSLISAPLKIEKLRVENVRVNLLSNEAGEDNWVFFAAEETDDDQPQERPTLPAILADALITDLVLSYDAPQREQPLTFTATEIRALRTDADALQVDLVGDLNETPLELMVSAGVVSNLLSYRDVDFDVSGHLGEIRFDGEAAVGDLLLPHRPTASLQLQGPNAEYLTDILRVQRITTGPLDLTATIVPVGSKMQLLVNGIFGEFSLDVTGQFADLQDLHAADLRIAASGPDTSAVARLFGNDAAPADPFTVVGNLQRSGQSLTIESIKVTIGKSQFDIGAQFDNFPDPRSARAAVRIEGPDVGRFSRLFGLPGKLTGPFTLDAGLKSLADGKATVNLAASAKDVQFDIVADVSDHPNFVGTRAEIKASGPNLQTVTMALGLEQAPADSFELTFELERVAEGMKIETGSLLIANDQISLQGLVGDNPMQADTDIQFDISIPNLARTLTSFGRDADELPDAKLQASGRIERGTDSFLLHDVRAYIGEGHDYLLTIDGQINPESDFVGSKLQVSAKGKSLGALTDAAGVEGMPGLPFELSGSVTRLENGISVEDGKARVGEDHATLRGFVADKPLQGNTDISFDARAPDLKASLTRFGVDIPELPAGPFDAAGEIRFQGKHFAIRNFRATLAGAKLGVDGRLGPFPELDGTKLKVQLDGADLLRLLPDEQYFSAFDKPFGLSAEVAVNDNQLSLSGVSAFVDKFRLSADVELSLSPALGSGRFSIHAASPDLFPLIPRLKDISVPDTSALKFDAKGTWADKLWTLEQFSLHLGDGYILANGIIDGPPNFTQTDLRSTLKISSMSKFNVLAGREFPDEAAHLTLHLIGNDEVMTVEEFEGTLGESDISGEFTFRAGEVNEIDFGLRSKKLNLAPYLPELTEEDAPKTDSSATQPKSSRVIPDTIIPIDELRNYEVSANIDIAELVLRHRTLSDVLAIAVIEDGALKLTKFNIRSSEGEEFSGSLDLHPVESGAEFLLGIKGSGLSMGLSATTVEEVKALPRYSVDAVLHGMGKTVRELAGSLNGYTRIVLGPGDIRTGALSFFTNDFLSEVLTTVNPFAVSDPYTHYECAAVLMRIKDGIVEGRPAAVLQSTRLRIFTNVAIDLKTEKLNATIRTVPRKGLGLSFSDLINPYTMISGTLASPSLTLDPEGALIEGGAAVATGGLSILAKRFNERFLAAKDACGKAIKDADPEFQAVKKLYFPITAETNPP
jgi:uncharacterized protein involved in outer membrane biogenesis